MKEPRVVVIGGGLAGMTVAKELLKHGLRVVVLEASSRLGGKAGADLVDSTYEEHGYHVFPGWYANTRQLLRELSIEGNLIDIDKFHHLKKGEFPNYCTFHPISSPRNLFRNIRSGRLPMIETILSFYFMLDLICEPFKMRGFLDRVSSNGLLRSRFYGSETIATLHQDTCLQASAIPNYEISAMTTRRLGMCWLRMPVPIFSILNGNLHEKFIRPFEKYIRSLGAEVQFRSRVEKLDISAGRISGLKFKDGNVLPTGPEDTFVLATPPEVTVQFITDEVFATAPTLANVVYLRSAPMAALHLYLKRRIPNIPKEHVTLVDSRYGTSFIDESQNWEEADPGKTTLSVISSNFGSLSLLSGEEMAKRIVWELQEYIPDIRDDDIERTYMRPNVDVPLFINTVGSWPFRPGTRTGFPNLYITGDYCQTEADLTTMESAISSGVATAGAILSDLGIGNDASPLRLKTHGRLPLLLVKFATFPAVYLLACLVRSRE